MDSKKDFSDIDLIEVEISSKNVYLYFSNRVVSEFEDIERLKEIQFKTYAKKHNRSIKEILGLYDFGFEEGRKIVEYSIIERSKISSEAGKFYLFEIASIFNLGAEYFSQEINIHFREYTELAFDSELIKNIGRIIGKFYFSWVQVLENHRLFEPLFKPEIDRIRNSFPNKPLFPCHNVKMVGLPSKMQIAIDFNKSIDELVYLLESRSEELLKGTIDELNLKHLFRYDILREFSNQCYDFLKETTDNMNNGIYAKYSTDYLIIKNKLIKGIDKLEDLKPIFIIDMSFIYGWMDFRDNWFVVVSNFLVKTRVSLDNITSYNKSPLTGFQSSLTDLQIRTLFDLMKGTYIDGNTNLDHFKAIFKNEQLPQNCLIKWLKTNVLLAYFIKNIFHSDNPFDVWVKAEKIFGIKNLRQSENNPHPKGENGLSIILNPFLNNKN